MCTVTSACHNLCPQGVLVGRAREEQAAAGSPGEVAELQRKLVTVQEELTEMHRCLLPPYLLAKQFCSRRKWGLLTPDSFVAGGNGDS